MHHEKLGTSPEALAAMYSAIDSRARQLAPQELRNELMISQDRKVKTRFYVTVSKRMAPYLITAIQQQTELEIGMDVKSYFYELQERVFSQMFAGVKDVIS